MRLFIAIWLAWGIVLSAGELARAHDPHHRADLNEWAAGLKSAGGTPCCNGEDWEHAEAEQWENDAGRFRVKLKDKWVEVPPSAMVKGQNRVGIALVWYFYINGEPVIRCFMPGQLS